MDRDKINYVKSELKQMAFLNREIFNAQRKRDEAINKLTGVSSPSGKQEPISSVSGKDKSNLAYWMEVEKECDDKINKLQPRVDKLNSFLGSIEERYKVMLIDIYVKGKNMDNVAIWNYYTDKVELHRDLDEVIDVYFSL